MLVTTSYDLVKVPPPALPQATPDYSKAYQDQLNNVLRIYFNRLTNLLGQLMASGGTDVIPVSIGGTNVDAFGRVRASQPYTLFDSQNRYTADTQFDTYVSGTGNTNYLPNESTLDLQVTSSGIGTVIRQTYRCFPYQPGKGLLTLATFVMTTPTSGLTQCVGYFNSSNGVFFETRNTVTSFVMRSSTGGYAVDTRVNQADWNGDPLNGTGASGITLDVTKAQILWMDFEWLGVGSVRCGFIIDGQYIVCHTFNNANDKTKVYMTTAILPIRYEITTTSAQTATLKQICSSVISEGGYEQYSIGYIARRTTAFASISTTFKPIVSIRLSSDSPNAVVVPNRLQVLPTTSQNYEVALLKNATLTGASWVNMYNAQGTGTVSGTTMTISAMISGAFQVGQLLSSASLGTGRYIRRQLTGTAGGAGTYELSTSSTVSVAETISALGNIEYDTSSTAVADGLIIQSDYVSSSGSGGTNPLSDPAGYNWAFQPGVSINGVCDVLTLAIRTLSATPTGDAVGSISLWDLTGN